MFWISNKGCSLTKGLTFDLLFYLRFKFGFPLQNFETLISLNVLTRGNDISIVLLILLISAGLEKGRIIRVLQSLLLPALSTSFPFSYSFSLVFSLSTCYFSHSLSDQSSSLTTSILKLQVDFLPYTLC